MKWSMACGSGVLPYGKLVHADSNKLASSLYQSYH